MAPRSQSRLLTVLCGAASVSLLSQAPSFLVGGGSARISQDRAPQSLGLGLAGPAPRAEPRAEASHSSYSVMVGLWAAAVVSAAATARKAEPAAEKAAEAKEEPKAAFDVWKPDTYGNLTMDDVKKYGQAGTLAYVITELAFWAIAFPTECFAFLNTVGHWPDFSKPEESAEVLGLVFAASNIARLLLPLRFGAALALAPWVDENIMSKFKPKEVEA